MSFSEEIVSALRARVQSGETYAEISHKSGISDSQIHRLVNHQADPMKMSLLTFAALFPRASILLDGRTCEDGVGAFDLSDYVPRSDYAALRDQYQDLRDRYQDLREQYLDLKSAPPYTLDGAGPAAPYRVPSTPSSSIK